MSTKIYRGLALLLGVLFVSACETVIDIDLPEHKPEIVVNSFFTPDSTWSIQLSSTAPIVFSSAAERKAIENPVIELWSETEQITDFTLLQTDIDGTKRFRSSTRPVAGTTYSIRVDAEGFEPVVGQNITPSPPNVDQFSCDKSPVQQEYGEVFDCKINLNDPANLQNYYSLFVLWHSESFDRETGMSYGKTTFPSGFTTRDPSLVDPDFFDTEESFAVEAFFTDDLFNGRSTNLEFSVATGFFDGPDFRTEQSYEIYFSALTEDMYRYLRTAQQQKNADDDPFAEPVQIHSNMSNGFGIFAGYQSHVFTIIPDSLQQGPIQMR